jgi:hypothetical protein
MELKEIACVCVWGGGGVEWIRLAQEGVSGGLVWTRFHKMWRFLHWLSNCSPVNRDSYPWN